MNLGIVIGVSEYANASNLPGCKNDAEAVYNVLNKSEKFTNILYINKSESSSRIKDLVINFISDNKQNSIEDFFFYYSGHGEFINNEFYYILSDYDSKKRNQTSLQNKEIDDLIRNISPKLVIKMIDACQSGTTYIKDSGIISKYFDDSKNSFNNCYFLSSSLNNQSSYQNDEISDFTNSFLNAIRTHDSSEIRYKDIIDVILDDFSDNDDQTPFFVIQANFTEKFCTINDSLIQYLAALDKEDNNQKGKEISIIELVKKNAEEYVDKAGAIESLISMQENFTSLILDEPLKEIYENEIQFLDDYDNVPQKLAVANWLKQNKGEYFTTPVYSTEYDEDGNDYEVLVGFELKIDTPFKVVSIDVIGKFPNLINYNSKILFIVSKRLIRLFYYITNYIEENWDSSKLNSSDIRWITEEFRIKDKIEISTGIDKIKDIIQARILHDLNEKFSLSGNSHPNKSDSQEPTRPTGSTENSE